MVGAREYDPEIGRFLQPDPRPTGPELQWGQLNRWAYCANDPVNFSDPTGQTFGLNVLIFFLLGMIVGMAVKAAGMTFDAKEIFAALAAMIAGIAGVAQCTIAESARTLPQFLQALLLVLAVPVAELFAFGGAAIVAVLATYTASFVAGVAFGTLLVDGREAQGISEHSTHKAAVANSLIVRCALYVC